MKGAGGKNSWALFLLLLTGIVLGGFIGMLAEGVPALSWLGYGQTFGLDTPIVVNLGLLVIGRQRVAGVVHQRELHGLDVVAIVVDVVGVLGLGHGAGAVGAVGQVQDGLGLLGVQQVGLHRGLGNAVGGVQVAVGIPKAVGRVGSLGGGSISQHTAQLVFSTAA